MKRLSYYALLIGSLAGVNVYAADKAQLLPGKVGTINSILSAIPLVNNIVTEQDARVIKYHNKLKRLEAENKPTDKVMQKLEKAAQAQAERDAHWMPKKKIGATFVGAMLAIAVCVVAYKYFGEAGGPSGTHSGKAKCWFGSDDTEAPVDSKSTDSN